jgi:RimJ/RimL family protein N-acetyltransferase
VSLQRPIPLPDPELDDGEVHLRAWRRSDVGALVAAWSDPEVARWTAVPPGADPTFARKWIEGDDVRRRQGLTLDLVISDAPDGPVLGEVGLAGFVNRRQGRTIEPWGEVGFWVVSEQRRKGLAHRAVSLLTTWALDDLLLGVVAASVQPGNVASAGVLERAGFASMGRGEDGWPRFRYPPPSHPMIGPGDETDNEG